MSQPTYSVIFHDILNKSLFFQVYFKFCQLMKDWSLTIMISSNIGLGWVKILKILVRERKNNESFRQCCLEFVSEAV